MRILIDHSGYELLNIGDVSMLQVCYRRLRELWPDAEFAVITKDGHLLEQYCPGATAVDLWSRPGPLLRRLPGKAGQVGTQLFKIVAPELRRRSRDPQPSSAPGPQHDLLRAIDEADIVVASGGGYVTDVFWWHGAGVLSVLRLAQRLGKPTALFGQGLGPLTNRVLRRHLRNTLWSALAVGLREGVLSARLVADLGLPPAAITVTGDDALEIATPERLGPLGTAIGLNIRIAEYTGTDSSLADDVRTAVLEVADRLGAPVIAVPVSRYRRADTAAGASQDLAATTATSAIEKIEIETPEELAAAARRCRVIVTSSYHAAVYGLANGAAVVCLVAHSYYEAKFAGLAALFPDTATVLRLDEPAPIERLTTAVEQAWEVDEAARAAAHRCAQRQVAASRALYWDFHTKVVAESAAVRQ